MEQAAEALEFERAASIRDRIRGLTHVQGQNSINLEGVGDADVVALHQAAGQSCVQVFFFRGGRNNGNRSFFLPRQGRCGAGGCADRLPLPALRRPAAAAAGAALPQPARGRADRRGADPEGRPQGGAAPPAAWREARGHRARRHQCARGPGAPPGREHGPGRAAGRRAEAVRPARGAEADRDLRQQPYPGQQCLWRHGGRGARWLHEGCLSQIRHPGRDRAGAQRPPRRAGRRGEIVSADDGETVVLPGIGEGRSPSLADLAGRRWAVAPRRQRGGDDFAMMREVFERRFGKALKEDPERAGEGWPDLVLIDGGAGQLSAARAIMAELGLEDLPMVAVAKGPDRDAGREWFHREGHAPIQLPPRDPVLYYLQRLRDEAHRFAITTHRAGRSKSLTRSELDEIPGVGSAIKRRLLNHFGSARGVRQAGLNDLNNCPGIGPAMATRIHEHFHPGATAPNSAKG
ncbi:helix-hairpin-helix domain-containing protein [Pseudoroseomonas wenyumeiae]